MTPPPEKNFVPQHPFHQTPTRSHSSISIILDTCSPMLHQLLQCMKPDVNCEINMKTNAACTASATSSASGISASCISSSLGHLMKLTRLREFHNQFTLNQVFCGDSVTILCLASFSNTNTISTWNPTIKHARQLVVWRQWFTSLAASHHPWQYIGFNGLSRLTRSTTTGRSIVFLTLPLVAI